MEINGNVEEIRTRGSGCFGGLISYHKNTLRGLCGLPNVARVVCTASDVLNVCGAV